MRLTKRIAAALTAAAMAVTALTVTAFAVDPVGTNPTKLKEGKQVTAQVKYVKGNDYDKGHNYIDFKYTAPADGVMILTVDAAINHTLVNVYDSKTKKEVECTERMDSTGKFCHIWTAYGYLWDETAGLYAGTMKYEVKKGDYIIRVSRCFSSPHFGKDETGALGNGRIHITAEMKKPDAPTDIQATKRTSSSVTLSWSEPDDADSYDIRYRVNGETDWQTKNGVKDNTATIKDLKANTKYTVQIRSKAGKITGEWGDKVSVTTDAAGELTAPVVADTMTITWAEVDGADSYQVSYSTDAKNWSTVKVKTNACAIKVNPGVKYYYAVQAVSGSKVGPWSATRTVTVTK